VGRLLQQPAAQLSKTCGSFRLAALLTPHGAAAATDVLVELLKRHAPSGRLPVSLSEELLHGCPTYFPYRQQVYLQAFQLLEGINKPGLSECAAADPSLLAAAAGSSCAAPLSPSVSCMAGTFRALVRVGSYPMHGCGLPTAVILSRCLHAGGVLAAGDFRASPVTLARWHAMIGRRANGGMQLTVAARAGRRRMRLPRRSCPR
jgi:hypothetical protein